MYADSKALQQELRIDGAWLITGGFNGTPGDFHSALVVTDIPRARSARITEETQRSMPLTIADARRFLLFNSLAMNRQRERERERERD